MSQALENERVKIKSLLQEKEELMLQFSVLEKKYSEKSRYSGNPLFV